MQNPMTTSRSGSDPIANMSNFISNGVKQCAAVITLPRRKDASELILERLWTI